MAVSLFESKQARENFSAITMIKDHLAAIAIIQVFVSIQPLPLMGELVLVPVSSALVALSVFSENKLKFAPAKKLFDVGLSVIVVALLVWSGIGFSEDPLGFSGNLLTNVTIPIMLTVGFIPFLAAFYLFMGYERTVGDILRLEDTTRLEKIKLILRCFKTSELSLQNIALLERHMRLQRPSSSSEVIGIVENVSHTFALRTSSYKPPVFDSETVGWEVKAAQNCLVFSDLRPDTYEWLGFVWQASDSIRTTARDSSSTLTYYVVGTRELATELELLFEVFGDEADEDLFAEYIRVAFSLLVFALGDDFDASLHNRVEKMKSFTTKEGDRLIDFVYKEFASPSGQEARLTVRADKQGS